MAVTHIIYHLPGRKVGCCKDLEVRKQHYPRHQVALLKILEELHDHTDQEAGDREWWWADKLGHKRGPHYTTTLSAVQSSAKNTPYEKQLEKARRLQQKRAKLSPERLSQIGRVATAHLTPEQRSANARLGGMTTTPETGRKVGTIQAECPHCGLKANLGNLKRWHFDKCSARLIG